MSTPSHRLTALTVCVEGVAPDPELEARLVAGGWTVSRVSRDSVLRQRVPVDTAVFVECGNDWERGIAFAEKVEATVTRSSMVLTGGKKTADLGRRLRRLGVLSWWRAPYHEWVLPTLADAIRRTGRASVQLGDEFLTATQTLLGQAPEAVVQGVAMGAAIAIHAVAGYAVVAPEGEEIRDLPGTGVPIPAVARDAATLAWEYGDISVIADVAHDIRACPEARDGPLRAAMAAPLLFGLTHPGARAAIVLTWQEARMPTSGEVYALRALVGLAAVAWARRSDVERLAAIHSGPIQALEGVPWATPRRAIAAAEPEDYTVDAAEEARLLRETIERTLRVYERCPGLQALWVRVGVRGPGEDGDWLRVPADAPTRPPLPDADIAAIATSEGSVVPLGLESETTVLYKIVPSAVAVDRRFEQTAGLLVASFERTASARDGMRDVARLPHDIRLALQLHRRAADQSALSAMSRLLTQDLSPEELMERLARIAGTRLHATGAKMFVAEPEGGELLLRQVARSDGNVLLGRAPLSGPDGPGLADWVYREGDGLVIRHRPMGPDGQPPPDFAWCWARPAWAPVRAKSEAAYNGDSSAVPVPDDELHQILVPVKVRGEIAGVLSVWRSTEHPFDPVIDVESIERIADHAGAVFARWATVDRLRAEAVALSELVATLTPERPPNRALRKVLQLLHGIVRAEDLVLLRAEADGSLRLASTWQRRWSEAALVWLSDLVVPGPFVPAQAPAQVAAAIEAHGAAKGRVVHVRRGATLVIDEGNLRGVVVALEPEPRPFPTCLVDRVAWSNAKNFLDDAVHLLARHRAAYEHAVVASIVVGTGDEDPLVPSVDALRAERRDVASVAYIRAPRGLRSIAPAGDLCGLELGKGSLAWQAMEEKRTIRVVDVDDVKDPNHGLVSREAARRIAELCGWKDVRSVICAPLVHDNHALGVIAGVTREGGRWFDEDDERLFDTVARRAAPAVYRRSFEAMIHDLNELSRDLAALGGDRLRKQLVVRLEAWLLTHLKREAKIVIIGRAHGSVAFQAASDGVDPEPYVQASAGWSGAEKTWSGREGALAARGTALPLKLATEASLGGHFCVLHPETFAGVERKMLAEAAREVSLLIYTESLRHEALLREGVFRHALLGPVQGVVSNALAIATLSQRPTVDHDRVQKLASQVASDAEIIHRSREAQRLFAVLYQGVELAPVRRAGPLGRVVGRCVNRYRTLFDARGIVVQFHNRIADRLLQFDSDLIDLAVTNLLDNARKYAWFHRPVTVTAEEDGRSVRVIVEDFGAEIPKKHSRSIYEPGGRVAKRDPTRTIIGEGIGLYLARTIALAHGGDITHTCTIATRNQNEPNDRTPYHVVFRLTLPLNSGRVEQ